MKGSRVDRATELPEVNTDPLPKPCSLKGSTEKGPLGFQSYFPLQSRCQNYCPSSGLGHCLICLRKKEPFGQSRCRQSYTKVFSARKIKWSDKGQLPKTLQGNVSTIEEIKKWPLSRYIPTLKSEFKRQNTQCLDLHWLCSLESLFFYR